jgi:hypothetical protein
MTDSQNNPEQSSSTSPRAPYSAPRLQTFGTFASLTRTVGMMGLLADTTAMSGSTKTM